ncbi:ATP-dependent DNA helicase [Lactobacillus helveticus]|nr:ATP-dependent DNA helicase [Lactobacillus helveticus]
MKDYELKVAPFYNSDPRLAQVQMSLDIADFLFNSNKRVMFVEAPVGTGKTLGVLVPSYLYAKLNKKRITYATATKNLQKQIFEDDIPSMRKMGIFKDNNVILAMGKDNYACISNVLRNKNKFSSRARYEEIKKAMLTSDTGLRSNLDQKIKQNITNDEWNLMKISSGQPFCSNEMCPGHSYRALFRSQRPPFLTITNHNQLIRSQLNEADSQKGIVSVLPGVVVVDEAHLFDENYLGTLQKRLSLNKLIQTSKNALKNDNQFDIRNEIEKITKYFSTIKNKDYGLNSRYELDDEIKEALSKIQTVLQQKEEVNTRNGRINFDTQYDETLEALHSILDEEKNISWLAVNDQEAFYYVPNAFYEKLTESIKYLARGNKVILLSGTLTSTDDQQKEIQEIQNEWGIENFIYKPYKSPFNSQTQTYLYVPRMGFNKPRNKKQHAKNLVKNIVNPICEKVSGGMLILCNSLELEDYIKSYVNPKKLKRRVLVQGDESNDHLTEKFKEDVSSILIGSGSFKSGFSVRGEALQSVIISALPFPVQTDPFIELKVKEFAKKYQKDDFEVSLQLMLKDLEQSMGRLIRSLEDYGIIAIADSRLYSKPYGPRVIEWLKSKKYKIFNNLDDLPEFIKNVPQDIKNEKAATKLKYSRNRLIIPIIEKSQKSTLKENEKINETPYENIEEYKRKARSWRKKYNIDHPQLKMKLKGLNDAITFKELIKVIGDAAYRAHEDPDDILSCILDIDYQKGSYEPDYDLVRNTVGEVKISYIK